MLYFLIINRSQTRAEPHTVLKFKEYYKYYIIFETLLTNLGFNVRIQGVVVDELEIIATVALPYSALLQLKPDNFLEVILANTTHHPDNIGF